MKLHLAHRIRTKILGLGIALPLAALGSSCVSQVAHEEALSELRYYQLQCNDLEAFQAQLEAENARLQAQLGISGPVTIEAGATRDIDERIDRLNKLMADLGATPDDVTVLSVEGGYGLRFSDAILFDSGSAELKPAGKSVLLKAVAQIKDSPYERIWVRGHTDSDPVKRASTLQQFPYGNIQLSAARAIQVAVAMRSEGGIPDDRLVVAGFGASDPVAPNGTADGKAKNRRVEIFVIEDEK